MDHYDKNILIKFLVDIDRFGNWLSGGRFEHTISARVGKYSNDNQYFPLWEWLESTVNLAFYPIDGPNHCLQAYKKEMDKDSEDDFKKGSKFMQFILSFIIIGACIPIAVCLWLYKGVKKLKVW